MSADKQRPSFAVKGTAELQHINVRKEGPEDERVLAIDMKLEIKHADRRLLAYFDDAIESFLWRGDSASLVERNILLDGLRYRTVIKDATAKVNTVDLRGCKVSKFTIRPRDGGVFNLTLSLSTEPSTTELAELSRFVQEDVLVEIAAQPDLFDAPAAMPHKESADDGLSGESMKDSANDPLYPDAVALVRKCNKGSISLVQREMRIGYNRAARLLEQMEMKGVVSALGMNGQRNVLAVSEG